LKGTYNKEQVLASANVIAATAGSGMGALFGPGTEKDVAGQKTRVKPEFFKEPDKVKELAMAYIKEANELQKVAATGDVAAIKVQFGKTGESCKACHEKFRND
jgi:cytochrome c556